MANKSGSTGGGGSKFFDKRLILIGLVAFALLVHTPAGLGAIGAVILFIATIFVVYHNGVQVSDFVVAFVLGIFLASTYLGDGARNVVNTVTDVVAQLPIAR